MQVGQENAFEVLIRETDIDAFAALSGDFSPLHMDKAFALSRGFSARVVHGAYLASLISRMVGMYLPGENCLLQTIQIKFTAPTYAGSLVRISGTVDQVSEAARAAILKIVIAQVDSGEILASAKVSIGFTEAREV
jgi:3-hydroxybutyryl-CoA dehydratase